MFGASYFAPTYFGRPYFGPEADEPVVATTGGGWIETKASQRAREKRDEDEKRVHQAIMAGLANAYDRATGNLPAIEAVAGPDAKPAKAATAVMQASVSQIVAVKAELVALAVDIRDNQSAHDRLLQAIDAAIQAAIDQDEDDIEMLLLA